MRRLLSLLLPLALAGCGGQAAQQAAIESARSVTAEWAAVERLAAAGRVPASYADQMRAEARDQLEADRAAIRDPALAVPILAVLRPGGASEAGLRRASAALDAIGKSHEDR
jgi:hypothetical protein